MNYRARHAIRWAPKPSTDPDLGLIVLFVILSAFVAFSIVTIGSV